MQALADRWRSHLCNFLCSILLDTLFLSVRTWTEMQTSTRSSSISNGLRTMTTHADTHIQMNANGCYRLISILSVRIGTLHKSETNWHAPILLWPFGTTTTITNNRAKKVTNHFRSIIIIRNQLSWKFLSIGLLRHWIYYSHAGRVLDPYRFVQLSRIPNQMYSRRLDDLIVATVVVHNTANIHAQFG